MSLKFAADYREACRNAAHAFGAALALDRQRRRNGVLEHTDFHPPAIALLETPASPTVHAFIGILVTLVVAFFVFAALAKVETIAEAPGEVIANGRSKVIQPFSQAIVRAIRVRDGQRVARGEVLIEFDRSQAVYDLINYRRQLQAAEWKARRASALARLAQHSESSISDVFQSRSVDGVADYRRQRELVARTIETMRQHRVELDDEIAAKAAALAAARAASEKYAETLPLLSRRVEQRQSLVPDGYQTEFAQSELRQQLIEMQKDYAAQLADAREAEWALDGAREEAQRTTEEFIAQQLSDFDEAQTTISDETRNVSASLLSLERLTLRSPIDGLVQQLAVHTVRGVVTPGEELMVIAPAGSESLEVTANVENKDIGFVRVGQKVRIKVKSYDFTRYGTIEGHVRSVSGDAVESEKGISRYPVQIALQGTVIRVGSKILPLRPGMDVTAEIITGSRTIAEYLMSPLRRTVDESLHER